MRRGFMVFACLWVGLSVAWGKSTESVQVTSGRCTVAAAFSPDGTQVAYVTAEEKPGLVRTRLWVWEGGKGRALMWLPGATGGDVVWSPDGKYLVQRRWPGEGGKGLLVRVADGAATGVAPYKMWFVMNADWPLTPVEQRGIRDAVHGEVRCPRTKPWGKEIAYDDVPTCVPHWSRDWTYYCFLRSPTNPWVASYVALDSHFQGCEEEKGAMRGYVGLVDLATGRLRRVSPSAYHIDMDAARWAPDGKHLAYTVSALCSMDIEDTIPAWSKLYVVRSDGSGRRVVARRAEMECWLSPDRLAVSVYRESDGARQIALVGLDGRPPRFLTKGRFWHALCDFHDDRYLILEEAADGGDGNLYIIRPL